MRQFSNKYIFSFATIMVVIVAFILSTAALLLQPKQQRNVEIEKQKSILSSVGIEATTENAEQLYQKYITSSFVINSKSEIVEGTDAFTIEVVKEQKKPLEEQLFPIYVATLDDGSTSYIIPLQGKGLWGPIWGYMALKEDLNTIYGVTFDHKGETPGLGAEINTSWFEAQFVGKQLFEGDKFTSIMVQKGGAAPGDVHAVDAISGGTITSKGLQAMIFDCISNYVDYLKNNSK
jgi:Na+-transporting NADH:ubiquinone oxidoreductase subunit C